MDMLTGVYSITLDEKGRLNFPAKLRTVLQQNELYVTQGPDHCLMLFTTEEWTKLAEKIIGSASLFNTRQNLVLREFIQPAQKLEFDKSGRLSIPQGLRDYASLLCGAECLLRGSIKYLELWDAVSYRAYCDKNEAQYLEAAEESMGNILL